jgi:hypothetical protein
MGSQPGLSDDDEWHAWLKTHVSLWPGAEIRNINGMLCLWRPRVTLLGRVPIQATSSSFSQVCPEEIRGDAPLRLDVAAGWEASGPIRHRLTGGSQIPIGAWPRRMCAAYAAGYCGELKIEDFLARVGTVYPFPRVNDGRRQLWLRDDLDRALLPADSLPITDAAEDL